MQFKPAKKVTVLEILLKNYLFKLGSFSKNSGIFEEKRKMLIPLRL